MLYLKYLKYFVLSYHTIPLLRNCTPLVGLLNFEHCSQISPTTSLFKSKLVPFMFPKRFGQKKVVPIEVPNLKSLACAILIVSPIEKVQKKCPFPIAYIFYRKREGQK